MLLYSGSRAHPTSHGDLPSYENVNVSMTANEKTIQVFATQFDTTHTQYADG